MIYDMPKYLIRDTQKASSRITGYTDDTTAYVKSENEMNLKEELEIIAEGMVNYCNVQDGKAKFSGS